MVYCSPRWRRNSGNWVVKGSWTVPSTWVLICVSKADSVFSGISTFGRLPYFPCLASDDEKYDIAFIGRFFFQSSCIRPSALISSCQALHSIQGPLIDRERGSVPLVYVRALDASICSTWRQTGSRSHSHCGGNSLQKTNSVVVTMFLWKRIHSTAGLLY